MAASMTSWTYWPDLGVHRGAARYKAGHAIVDDSLYWYHARSSGEAAYLTILLNAECLQQAYADSRSSGRHFDLQPWRKMPIPRYDNTIALHKELAALCTRAENIAARTLKEALKATPGKGQVAMSKAVRNALVDAEIDAAMDPRWTPKSGHYVQLVIIAVMTSAAL